MDFNEKIISCNFLNETINNFNIQNTKKRDFDKFEFKNPILSHAQIPYYPKPLKKYINPLSEYKKYNRIITEANFQNKYQQKSRSKSYINIPSINDIKNIRNIHIDNICNEISNLIPIIIQRVKFKQIISRELNQRKIENMLVKMISSFLDIKSISPIFCTQIEDIDNESREKFNQAKILLGFGHLSDSSNLFFELYFLYPQNFQIRNNYCYTLIKKGQYLQAKPILSNCLKKKNCILFNLALCEYNLKQFRNLQNVTKEILDFLEKDIITRNENETKYEIGYDFYKQVIQLFSYACFKLKDYDAFINSFIKYVAEYEKNEKYSIIISQAKKEKNNLHAKLDFTDKFCLIKTKNVILLKEKPIVHPKFNFHIEEINY